MDMISEYVATISEIDNIQENGLGNKKKVKQNNKLVDRLREIASEIDSGYPEMKPRFYQLLFHEKETVRIWAIV